MDNRYFPNQADNLNFVMKIYENEINNRNEWVKESAIRLNESLKGNPASFVISNAMSVINHAMLILRLVDKKAIGARTKNNEKEKAIERAKILHERNPMLPDPPETLRKIRNDYEHFEARLDEWATSPNPNKYIDLNVGGGIFVECAEDKDTFRQFEGSDLTFWNNKVDLQEVVDWTEKVSEIVTENNRRRL